MRARARAAAVGLLALSWSEAHAGAPPGSLRALALDGSGGAVDPATSFASIERTPPADVEAFAADPDALRFVVVGERGSLPSVVSVVTTRADGGPLDALAALPVLPTPCPAGTAPADACVATAPVRAVADDVDRDHPLARERSVRAEVGGALALAAFGRELLSFAVGGPRTSPAGPIGRLRGRLRVHVVRDYAKGPPPFGADDAAALALAESQVAWTNAVWGQCGVRFVVEPAVRLVDPPPPHLLALGCDLGLPASGGEVRVVVEGKPVRAVLRAGQSPRGAARVVARAIEAAGFVARVSENARIDPGALGSADVLVRRRDGALATIEPPDGGRVSTDATLSACIGGVDLRDGLDHFTDADAAAGTVEERTLIKAFDDGDPRTLDVVLMAAFAGGGRIGESFIVADRSSIRNVVLSDRGGVRADRASFALAHELGHILLDMPGHPDDFGVDTPTRLMDADAADPSAFGPRRLTLDECARMVHEAGPEATVPLLVPWPLAPARAGVSAR